MKLKLTPKLSYIIGLWKETRTTEGIGVYGTEEHLSLFTKAVLDAGLTEPTRLLASGPKEPAEPTEGKPMEEEDPFEPEKSAVYFYHTSYRKFFQKVVDDELERFKYKNEYSGNFLAGIFDAVGTITKDGKVYLSRCTQKDEMLLYRMGFNPIRRGKLVYFTRPKKFLAYIKPLTKKFKGHPILSRI
jgi:hypothetical protein